MSDLNLISVKHLYKNFKFYVKLNLITDFIIGDDLLQQCNSAAFNFEGQLPELIISCEIFAAQVPYPQLFDNFRHNCRPFAIKTR